MREGRAIGRRPSTPRQEAERWQERDAGAALPPGSSAYVVLVDGEHAAELAALFAAEGARVVDLPAGSDPSFCIRETLTRRVPAA